MNRRKRTGRGREEEEEPEIDWIFVVMVIMSIAICSFSCWLCLLYGLGASAEEQRAGRRKNCLSSSDRRAAVRALFDYSMNLLSVAGLPIRNISLYRYGEQVREMFDEELQRHTGRRRISVRRRSTAPMRSQRNNGGWRRFKDKMWERVYQGRRPLPEVSAEIYLFPVKKRIRRSRTAIGYRGRSRRRDMAGKGTKNHKDCGCWHATGVDLVLRA